jgi:TolA-binding protein
MDCEKFESAMMGELHGELDELTSAAAKRHVAGCARCSARLEGLRATRRLALMPLVESPADLQNHILSATMREAQRVAPVRGRLARGVSLAGSWAMRPQTAMAALFLVMIGTSVLLLRGKSSRAPPSEDVTVTEQGVPASEPAPAAVASTALPSRRGPTGGAVPSVPSLEPRGTTAALAGEPGDDPRGAHGRAASARAKDEVGVEGPTNAPLAATPANTPGPSGSLAGAAPPAEQDTGVANRRPELSPFDSALEAYRGGRFDDAARAFDALSAGDPNADLWAARSLREGKGCRSAVARFDKVARRASGSPPGWDALLEGALCYRALGDFGNARVYWTALLSVDSHKDRARAELDRLGQLQRPQTISVPAARSSPKGASSPTPPSPGVVEP